MKDMSKSYVIVLGLFFLSLIIYSFFGAQAIRHVLTVCKSIGLLGGLIMPPE